VVVERLVGGGLALVLLALAFEVHACRCEPLTLADAFGRADVVAEVEIEHLERGAASDSVHATVQVIDNLKNAAGLQAVTTTSDGAQCGLALQPGRRYWIFGRQQPGSTAARISTCDGSRPVSEPFLDTPTAQARDALRALAAGLDCPSPSAAEIAARLSIATDLPADAPLTGGVGAPNGAYAFVLEQPTTIQRPPRVARLIVDHERDTRLELSLHGVAEPVEAQWINEKLILVQAHWSRTLRSDLMLDVEAGGLIAVETGEVDAGGAVLRWLNAACGANPG
jgi:hypothetical protein